MEARSLTSVEFFSTRLSGSTQMRRGLPKVSTVNARIRADDFDSLVFGLAVGIDLQFHRHAEQIEVLRNLADHAEALVVAQPVDRCTWS